MAKGGCDDAANGLTNRALVIEDSGIIAIETAEMLARLGFGPVDIAHDLVEARRHLEDRNYALAVVDIRLGGDDALAAARILSERGAPFVFASGAERPTAPFAAIPFLAKPFHETALRDAVRAALDVWSSAQ